MFRFLLSFAMMTADPFPGHDACLPPAFACRSRRLRTYSRDHLFHFARLHSLLPYLPSLHQSLDRQHTTRHEFLLLVQDVSFPQSFKCSLITLPRRNGEHVILNQARVKRYTETSSQPGLCQKYLNESRSSSLMRTCKNPFSISPVSKIG